MATLPSTKEIETHRDPHTGSACSPREFPDAPQFAMPVPLQKTLGCPQTGPHLLRSSSSILEGEVQDCGEHFEGRKFRADRAMCPHTAAGADRRSDTPAE